MFKKAADAKKASSTWFKSIYSKCFEPKSSKPKSSKLKNAVPPAPTRSSSPPLPPRDLTGDDTFYGDSNTEDTFYGDSNTEDTFYGDSNPKGVGTLTQKQKKAIIDWCIKLLPEDTPCRGFYHECFGTYIVRANNLLKSREIDGGVQFGENYYVSMADYKSIISDIIGQFMINYLKKTQSIKRGLHYNQIVKETKFPFDDHSGEDYKQLFYWNQEFFPLSFKTEEFLNFTNSIIYANATQWKNTILKQ